MIYHKFSFKSLKLRVEVCNLRLLDPVPILVLSNLDFGYFGVEPSTKRLVRPRMNVIMGLHVVSTPKYPTSKLPNAPIPKAKIRKIETTILNQPY